MDTKEKLKLLGAILRGKPELAKEILADAENVQKAAEEAGLEFKEVEEMISGSVPETPTEEAAAVVDTPAVEDTPEAEPEVLGIGNMTVADLTAFVGEIVNQVGTKQAEPIQAKQAGLEAQLAEALATLKETSEKLETIEHTMAEQKQLLQDFTDARPAGIKQLQDQRPTTRTDNVVTKTFTGPQIDEGFQKFALGGK